MRNQVLFYSLAVASFAVSAGAVAANAACFYPDGTTTDPVHRPCNTTIGNSACCDPMDSCTTNGICLGRSGFNYRGSCTDSSWKDPTCPTACRANADSKLPYSAFTPLWTCDAPGGRNINSCCDIPNKNCCTIAPFVYPNTGFAFKNGMDQLLLDVASANTSGQATVTVTATAGSSSSTGSSAESSTSTAAASSSSNLGPAIGAGVGVPLGVLALGLLGFLFWRARKNSNGSETLHQGQIEMDPHQPKPFGDYYASPPPPAQQPYQPPPPQQPYQSQPAAEADGRASQISRSYTHSTDRKSPGYGGPSGVHE
ncbi:hypothetical protein LSUE1_G005217 [Lachnellula suecica]|uniref:Mid2 domain-containing protein n=1 Tax=Lachnellula suecica TaxID=602035 RepID=A0A8T9BYN2_9HELO|nr:hypothetical protein LSUE1_G005217 [Lachnellula suecica]